MNRGAALLLLLYACASEPPRPAIAPPIEVAITVDDLPIHGPSYAGIDRRAIGQQLLEVFAKHQVGPVYGFVNGKKVDDDPATRAILEDWVAAGHPLGNHTWSHISLNEADVPAYLADLEKGEAILESLAPLPGPWKIYRYPYLFEGDTLEKRDAVRAYLAEHGYQIAPVTIDGNDWAFNPPYARCLDKHDAATLATLRERFVQNHLDELNYIQDILEALEQRPVPHVLLLHIGAADAAALDALLTAYEQRGVRWIPLEKALADPLYAQDPKLPARYGAALPYRLMKARGLKRPLPAFGADLEASLDAVCR
jgi:peptidoglycan-N-acetylglucosamine deacetylase